MAEKLTVSAETVSRLKCDFDFMAALNSMLQENRKVIQDRLRSLSGKALDTIESVMLDSESSAKEKESDSYMASLSI